MTTLVEEHLAEHLLTYAEYRELDVDDNLWYELLNGELVKKSSPSPRHQRASMKLSSIMHLFTSQQNLGLVYCAPIDVFVDEYNVPQPDILFIRNENKHIITSDGIMGAPDLVVEILSPSSILNDRGIKQRLYQRLGVQEYWIVDPKNNAIEVYRLTEGVYDLVSFAVERGTVDSTAIAGLQVEVSEIFEEQA
jgi:Uma2 family endonuclease